MRLYRDRFELKEVEPGLYEVKGAKQPGDEVSSISEVRRTLSAPLISRDAPDIALPSPLYTRDKHDSFIKKVLK